MGRQGDGCLGRRGGLQASRDCLEEGRVTRRMKALGEREWSTLPSGSSADDSDLKEAPHNMRLFGESAI
jgi:hypothetical protein